MSTYKFTTRQCSTLAELRPELSKATKQYISDNDTILICCETLHDPKIDTEDVVLFIVYFGMNLFFDRQKKFYDAQIITQNQIIHITLLDRQIYTSSMRLLDIVKVTESSLKQGGSSLHIQGPGQTYLSLDLGPQPETDKFKAELRNAIDKAKTIGESRMGDIFNLTGNFDNVNIKSTLVDVSQSISTIPNANESIKHELRKLVDQLNEELQKVPPEKSEEAEAVAEITKSLVETVGKEKPNKTVVQLSAEKLKQAAENLAAVTPIVLTIATQIVATIMKVIG